MQKTMRREVCGLYSGSPLHCRTRREPRRSGSVYRGLQTTTRSMLWSLLTRCRGFAPASSGRSASRKKPATSSRGQFLSSSRASSGFCFSLTATRSHREASRSRRTRRRRSPLSRSRGALAEIARLMLVIALDFLSLAATLSHEIDLFPGSREGVDQASRP